MHDDKPSSRKHSTQQALIEAAYGLFCRKGFSNTTTREIALQANVNEITLFRHFQNKFNLLSQVIAHHSTLSQMERLLEEMDAMAFEAGFHYFARTLISLLEEKYPMIRLMIIEATSNPDLKSIVGPIPVKLRQALKNHLERGVNEGLVRKDLDLELVAQSFLWIFLSYVMTRSDVGQQFCPFPPDDVAQASTDIFLQGLKP